VGVSAEELARFNSAVIELLSSQTTPVRSRRWFWQR
jgi:hypothetical protein